MPPHSVVRHREPPGPAMDRFHRGVEAHGPAPEQRRALGRGAAIDDLLDLALAAEAADREDGGAVHGEQQRRSVEEDDREHVERVVEQIAVADRERRGPVEVREDAERHRLAPAAHQDRADEAEHEVEPDRRGEGPGDVRAHAERARAPVDARPTRAGSTVVRKKPAISHQPPSFERRQMVRPYSGGGGSSASQGSWRTNWTGSQFDRGPHVEPDDLERDEAADQRGDPEPAEIDRADLGVADLAEPVDEARLAAGAPVAARAAARPA